jgi:signal transduction histidine kinase
MDMAASTKDPGENPDSFAELPAPCTGLDDSAARLKLDYLHVLSHDLQGSLQVIAGSTMLMEQASESGNRQLSSQLCEKILANVETVAKALREIVEVGAMEHGVGLDKSIVNVEHFVLRALDQGVPPADRLRIKLEPHSGLPVIEADEPKLRRAFLNLVHNALKFSPAEALVRVRLSATGNTVVLTVHDHGPGMSSSEVNRLFQKYQPSPQSKRRGGTGLGLYGCRLIVQAHQGRCRVESSPGAGTTFIIELPAKSAC